ncbi:MAG: nitronate monooxygenase [Promethearchaeota archaeon]|nr:MAG: nitronate monooxygenase [Candidatus Lokiarchaeota archaeon]
MVIETNITKMLGIKHPIIAAPMGPFYTTELTIAVSEAGGLGVISHASDFDRPEKETWTDREATLKAMKRSMERVVEHTDKPFGFNIRTSRVQRDAAILCKEIPKFIMNNPKLKEQCIYAVTSAGSSKTLPQSKSFQKLREVSNIKHFHVAPALWLADKCVASNVDGIVITGTEGGGHQSYEEVSTLVLLQQVLEKYPDFPIVACGGFATGRSLAAALSLGAGAVAMGSRFIASKESEFHETYKKIVPPARAQDTVLATGAFGPIRLWKNPYAASHPKVGSKEEKMAMENKTTIEEFLKEARAYRVIYEGDTENGAVLLGQSIGIIKSIEKVSDLISSIVNDAEKRIKSVNSNIK